MRCFKRICVFLFALAVLCFNPAVYISAAEYQVMSTNSFTDQYVKNGDASVTFTFNYSDGNSAKLAMVVNHSSDIYSMPNPPSSHFSGDTCYASVVLVHKTTGEKITLSAWCDIYGQTG